MKRVTVLLLASCGAPQPFLPPPPPLPQHSAVVGPGDSDVPTDGALPAGDLDWPVGDTALPPDDAGDSALAADLDPLGGDTAPGDSGFGDSASPTDDAPCVPETDAELCLLGDTQCGGLQTVDRCGFTRAIGECGPCGPASICEDNQCLPCGGTEQRCCIVSAAWYCADAGDQCFVVNGHFDCEPCGGQLDRCCYEPGVGSGWTCGGALTCVYSAQVCDDCGWLGGPCCAPDYSCHEGTCGPHSSTDGLCQ